MAETASPFLGGPDPLEPDLPAYFLERTSAAPHPAQALLVSTTSHVPLLNGTPEELPLLNGTPQGVQSCPAQDEL